MDKTVARSFTPEGEGVREATPNPTQAIYQAGQAAFSIRAMPRQTTGSYPGPARDMDKQVSKTLNSGTRGQRRSLLGLQVFGNFPANARILFLRCCMLARGLHCHTAYLRPGLGDLSVTSLPGPAERRGCASGGGRGPYLSRMGPCRLRLPVAPRHGCWTLCTLLLPRLEEVSQLLGEPGGCGGAPAFAATPWKGLEQRTGSAQGAASVRFLFVSQMNHSPQLSPRLAVQLMCFPLAEKTSRGCSRARGVRPAAGDGVIRSAGWQLNPSPAQLSLGGRSGGGGGKEGGCCSHHTFSSAFAVQFSARF